MGFGFPCSPTNSACFGSSGRYGDAMSGYGTKRTNSIAALMSINSLSSSDWGDVTLICL